MLFRCLGHNTDASLLLGKHFVVVCRHQQTPPVTSDYCQLPMLRASDAAEYVLLDAPTLHITQHACDAMEPH